MNDQFEVFELIKLKLFMNFNPKSIIYYAKLVSWQFSLGNKQLNLLLKFCYQKSAASLPFY